MRRASGPRGRRLRQVLRKAKGRSAASSRWLERQINDIYASGAREEGYRSRAAYKLIQIDERFGLLRRGARVVDLGAAPGGWSQVAARGVGGAPVVAVDLREMEPVDGVTVLPGDVREERTVERVREALGGPADLVLSDMASPATGHRSTDHVRTMALAEAAHACAALLLAPGGAFVAKVLRGGTEAVLLAALKRDFERIHHVKPAASRPDSREIYVVATRFRRARCLPPAGPVE